MSGQVITMRFFKLHMEITNIDLTYKGKNPAKAQARKDNAWLAKTTRLFVLHGNH